MSQRNAFIHSRRFGDYSYGDDHPLKVVRYRLACELMRELGLLGLAGVDTIDAPPASEEALLSFHSRDYLARLQEFSADDVPRADFFYGLGDVENPVFKGLYDWSALVCGGTLEAVRLVVEQDYRAAFNMAGGWHHAHAARASGFSYLNDAVVAINWLLKRGLRVAYVDIDAHHGDGVQEAFYATDRVLTISLHETGDDFFPHTGYCRELGIGSGTGYAVNIPLLRHADDRLFRRAFERVIDPLLGAFRPDVLVTQMGVDTLRADPLARLEMTTASLEYAAGRFYATGVPWVALGGGGYDKVNVARGWTLIWGSICQAPVPDLLPPDFVRRLQALGFSQQRLRDLPHFAQADDFLRAEQALEENLALLERELLPLHGLLTGDRR